MMLTIVREAENNGCGQNKNVHAKYRQSWGINIMLNIGVVSLSVILLLL